MPTLICLKVSVEQGCRRKVLTLGFLCWRRLLAAEVSGIWDGAWHTRQICSAPGSQQLESGPVESILVSAGMELDLEKLESDLKWYPNQHGP